MGLYKKGVQYENRRGFGEKIKGVLGFKGEIKEEELMKIWINSGNIRRKENVALQNLRKIVF